jgi:hypothetical protein
MRQTLPTVNRTQFLLISFTLCPYAHKRTQNRTLLFFTTQLKHGRHSDYWNQPLNKRMRFCHEAGLCCYLVIHIENLLHPLQLFYFRLWPLYWLSLVYQVDQRDNVYSRGRRFESWIFWVIFIVVDSSKCWYGTPISAMTASFHKLCNSLAISHYSIWRYECCAANNTVSKP